MSDPERPEGMPLEAQWDESDQEWVVSDRDEAGKRHGEVHFYRPDGSLVSISYLDHGVVEGLARRFHPNGEVSQIAHYRDGKLNGKREWFTCDEPTPETFYQPGMSRDIVRAEAMYADGRVASMRYFNRSDEEIELDGSPVKTRPSGVPDGAIWRPDDQRWWTGEWDERGHRVGEIRAWSEDGTLMGVEHYDDNVANGPAIGYRPDGTLRTRLHFVDGQLAGPVEYFHRNETLARRVEVADGVWVSDLVDFRPDGTEIDRVTPPESRDPTPLSNPSPAEEEWLEGLVLDELSGEPPESLSPAALADVLAMGWGGEEERDSGLARRARAVARQYPDSDLRRVLAQTKLNRAPRLLTVGRAKRLVEGIRSVDAVDSDRFLNSLVARGGVGARLGLSVGGARALTVLRSAARDARLVLTHYGLTELPPQIRHLVEIHALDLSNNDLREIPDAVADMVGLCRLEAGHNRIDKITPRLPRLNTLWTLYLNNNGLKTCPPEVLQCEELQCLNLSNNQIRELPHDIERLERLDRLWLHGNPLQSLPDSFANLQKLRFLHLAGALWEEPPAVIWELEQLQTLWLNSKSLRRLPREVARLHDLKELCVWYSGLEELNEALFDMTHLKTLRLSNCDVPEAQIDALRIALPDTKIL